MAELKTKANEANVQAFLETITDDQRHKDCLTIIELLHEITRAEAKMWGETIVGFGTSRLQYPGWLLATQTEPDPVHPGWPRDLRATAAKPGEIQNRQRLPVHQEA
jgi:hypothetical protein